MSVKGQIPSAALPTNFGLTYTENAEIALIVAGYTDEESAAKMGIGCEAFGSNLEGIFKKLKVSDRFELVLFALYYNLASLESIQKLSKSSRARSRRKLTRA